MNIATSEPSLFQLTQDMETPLVPLSVGAETLKSYVNSIIELLIIEQLQVTIWVKLPQTKSWLHQVERLLKEGNVERIFICSREGHNSVRSLFKDTSAKTPIISLQLKKKFNASKGVFLNCFRSKFLLFGVSSMAKKQNSD